VVRAGLFAAARAVIDSECGPRISFFADPEGNSPTAWGKSAQQTAGNDLNDQMLPIALTSTNNAPGRNVSGVPMLQVTFSSSSSATTTSSSSNSSNDAVTAGRAAAHPRYRHDDHAGSSSAL
jgi:hypothetical protein